MGRPLNKKYFGNRNVGSSSTTSDNGIGGEGVASVTITNGGSNYDPTTTTVTFSAPQLPGGVTATGTAVIAGGIVTGITITEKGSGYTSAPTVTITDPDGGLAEGAVTLTRTMTNTEENAIVVYAKTTSGGTNKVGDIDKQTGSITFRVTTADGTADCILITSGNASNAGEMTITATDSDGGEYWVKKISSHRVVLIAKGVGGGTQFANNTSVPWNLTGAVENQSVVLQNS